MIKIAFFDTKEYDQKLFDEYNKNLIELRNDYIT